MTGIAENIDLKIAPLLSSFERSVNIDENRAEDLITHLIVLPFKL